MRRILSVAVMILAGAIGAAGQAAKTNDAAAPRGGTKPGSTKASSAATQKLPAGQYGNLPLSFEANKGQTAPQVNFLARGRGYTLFLTPTQEVLALRHVIPLPENPNRIPNPKTPQKYSQTALTFDLTGANPNAQVSGADRLPGISNYYIGNDPSKWHAGIPNYGKIVYRNTYPGIDVAYYGNQGRLESDFIVARGADPGSVRMRVEGAKELQIAASGDLILSLEAGNVKLQKPVAYQIIHGTRREVRGGYKLLAANEVGFALGPYDHRRKLIIDPTLFYSSYLGGSGSNGDGAYSVAADSSGEAYVTGYTNSSNFPTQNAEQGSLGTGEDVQNAFVTKFSASGTSLVFSTYFGGNSQDFGNGIAVDSAGSAYVVGTATSSNFPTYLPLANQSTMTGSSCAFVSSFSSAGALTFSTYLCGGGIDYGTGVAVDSSKDIYATGYTESTSFPTVNAIQPTLAGPQNAFVSKLAAVSGNGSSLLFSTYFGGNGEDGAFGIALDGSSPPKIYIAGSTTSTVFPTKNAIQANNNSTATGGSNAFVAEMSVPTVGASGPSTVYATYLGGSSGADYALGIAADSAGNAYVAGVTSSPDFPTKNSLQTADSSGDAFVAKIVAGGGSLDFSTYFGGSYSSEANAIALDSSDNIYITGSTFAPDFPTRLPLQATLNNNSEESAAFVTEFKADGSDYIFSTYLGGSYSNYYDGDSGNGIALDSSGNIYVAGVTGTLDFPTVNPYQGTLNSPLSTNAFVGKIEPATPAGPQLFPAALNFGDVVSGTSSQPQAVTLANGTDALDITSVVTSGPNAGDFNTFSTCGQTVPATVVCNFTETFTPSTAGPESATVTITESSGTQTFNLSGTETAVPPPGTITVNTSSLTFGSQEVGVPPTGAQGISITVTSSNPVTLTSASTSGTNPSDFVVGGPLDANICSFGIPLSQGTTCDVPVEFAPKAAGARSAAILIFGTFTGSPASVPASGTGIAKIASLSPLFLSFPNTVVDTSSNAMNVTLANVSTTATLTAINSTITGNFSISGTTCPVGGGLGPGQSCTFSIVFSPVSVGSAGGELTITDSDPASQIAVLYGTGLNAAATLAPVFPTYIGFGRQTAGTTSSSQYVYLENIGNTNLTFTSTLGGSNPSAFQATDDCSETIAPGAYCYVSVTFTPPAAGLNYATLTISSSAAGAPQTVSISGTGIPASTASLLPNPLIFPVTAVEGTSSPEYAFLNNTGANADDIGNITISGADPEDFELTYGGSGNTPCFASLVLNAQAVCVIGVVFTPTQTGLRTATLQVTDSATGTPHTTVLQGGMATAPLQITTTSPLPTATVGMSYSTTLAAMGGTPPYSWTFVAGGLPTGLSLSSGGVISGTPTSAGTGSFTFSVQVADSMTPTPQTVIGTFTIPVNVATVGVTFTSTTLPNGAVGVPYGADIPVSGGTPPYTFALATGNSLPAGYTLVPTANGNVAAGHIYNNSPASAEFAFSVTVTDSTSPTPQTATAEISLSINPLPANTQPGLLKGQYALLIRAYSEVTGAEEGVVGSLTFDGSGNITGVIDDNAPGGISMDEAVTGAYSIGADNRGVMSITPAGKNAAVFALAVDNVYRGVAGTAQITTLSDASGSGEIGSGSLTLQDTTAFSATSFGGTYTFGLVGLDPKSQRVGELGFITFNNDLMVTSGTAVLNQAGTLQNVTSITGTYTAPDSNGRIVESVTLTPIGASTTAIYVISPNEGIAMTLDSRTTNDLLMGYGLRQPSPAAFSNTSLAGPDVISLGGTATNGTSALIGLLTATSNPTPDATITADSNDNGTLNIGEVLSGGYSVGTNGAATFTPTTGSTSLIIYLAQPDRGFAMTNDSSVSFGTIVPQVGGSFSASPFTTGFSFGQQEALPLAHSDFSGVGPLGSTANTLNLTDDESHIGGDLAFDQDFGTLNYTVSPTGHVVLQSATQGTVSGYAISPYEFAFLDQTSTNPHVALAGPLTAPKGTPSPASTTVNFTTAVAIGSSAQSSPITITNTGLGPLGISGTAIPPDFSFSSASTCLGGGAVIIQPQGTCTIVVTFAPSAGATPGAQLNETLTATTDGTSSITIAATGTVASGPPSALSIAKTHTGNFTQGQTGATYTVTVSNGANAGPTSGTVTVTENPPTGLTVTSLAGTGWTCTAASCTRSDALAAGASYPAITVTVNVAANATSPQVNSVTVSGGGSASATATDSTTIILVPLLSITKTHTGNFTQGQQGATYTVTVSNGANAGPTSGTVTVTENIPTGLTLAGMAGTGWTCATNTCTRSDALAAGASYAAITVTVNVAGNAPGSVTNSVTVSGGGSASATGMNPTTITPPPSLSITKTHTGNFVEGLTGTYTVTVSNAAGAGPTSGTVTVTENLPAAIGQLTNMTGTGWSCDGNVCTRSDALAGGASYAAITVTVSVADAPGSATNSVTVSGGGSANATATDATTIVPPAPVATLNPPNGSTLAFGGEGIGSSSKPQTVTITNTGNANLTVTSVTISEDSETPDFSETNTCTAALPPSPTAGSSCTISVVFTPTTTGSLSASLNIVTSDPNNPRQMLNLTGTGSMISLSTGPGGSTTVTVNPGGTAVYGLQLNTPPGTTGTALLGCTSPDASISCVVVPSKVLLTGQTIQTAIVVDTYCQAAVPVGMPVNRLPLGWLGLLCGLAIVALAMAAVPQEQRRRLRLAAVVPVLLAAMLIMNAACGSLAKSPTGEATQPGTYTLDITVTLGNSSFTLPVTLVVK